MSILDFNKKKPQGLHFGDDFVIRRIKDLKADGDYLFDKKKDRAWPYIASLLIANNGNFPYSLPMTDRGVLDVFNVLSDDELKEVGDGKEMAKTAIRDVMHKTMKQSAQHTVAIMLGFSAAVVFIIVLILVLLFVKGKLSVG